jgi:hypothetical protein
MRKLITTAAALACLAAVSAAQAGEAIRYQITFDAKWTAATHPLDYPGNAHFSGIIGATHNDSYSVFSDGGNATAGLEALSERGAHSPLDSEIKAAVAKGDAGALFESEALFNLPGSIKAEFNADERYPYVSAVAMVAPSPDWFTGVSTVPLMQEGKWIDQVTLTLWTWDAGTDHGTTYKAADADAHPRQSVRLNAAPQFRMTDQVKPVGTVTIRRIDIEVN